MLKHARVQERPFGAFLFAAELRAGCFRKRQDVRLQLLGSARSTHPEIITACASGFTSCRLRKLTSLCETHDPSPSTWFSRLSGEGPFGAFLFAAQLRAERLAPTLTTWFSS